MTMRLLFEEESGRSTGRQHPHNGYYAGDFSGLTVVLDPTPRPRPAPSLRLLRGAVLPSEAGTTPPQRRAA